MNYENKKFNSKLYIFVPVFNRSNLTKLFIENIIKQSFENFILYIIDDKSQDDTVEMVRSFSSLDKRINLIKTDGNKWWAGSLEFGLKKVYESGFIKSHDFIAFMNDDVFIERNLLKNLLKVLVNNPNSIISPVRVKGKKIIASGSRILNWPLALTKRPLNGKNFSRIKSQPLVEVDFIGANCTLFQSNLIKDIGYPNYLKLPHYHSDGEYFYRAKKLNYKIYLCPYLAIYRNDESTGLFNSISQSSLKDFLKSFFIRKSINNVEDRFNFAKLCCPKKYIYSYFIVSIFLSILKSISIILNKNLSKFLDKVKQIIVF